MISKIRKLNVIVLIIISLSVQVCFATVLSGSDGDTFVTKKEFEDLKADFQFQINNYNTSIDSKIDGAIASYIAGLADEKNIINSYISSLNEDRRTFVGAITNPTTSGQNDLYISTNGYWVWSCPGPYNYSSNWSFRIGYALCGLNNWINGYGHAKRLEEMNNGKNGKYIFVDTAKVGNKDVTYIYDNFKKILQYRIVSSGVKVVNGSESTSTTPTYGGPSSISWNNTYNWSGKNTRAVSNAANLSVEALEALMLNISNDDYDTAKEGIQEIPWIGKTGGSTIFTTEMGTLLKKNQYNWTNRITNFNIGYAAKQALTRNKYNTSTNNSYNSGYQTIPLSFNVPEFSKHKGNEMVVLDVSNKIGKPVYYYSGLPLFEVQKNSRYLSIKFVLKVNKPNSTTNSGALVALKTSQFGNKEINDENEADLIFKKEYSAGNIPESIELSFDESNINDVVGKELWIKVKPLNSNCTITVVPGEMYYY